MLFGGIVFRNRRARLHRVGHQPVVGDVHRNDIGRGLKGVASGRFVADTPVINDVAGRFGMKLWSTGCDGRTNVRCGRKLFVNNLDSLCCVARLIAGFRDHDGDRVSDKADSFGRHGRPRAHFHRRAVLGMDHPAADEISDLVVDELLAGQHIDHAWHLHGGCDVDAFDFCVGVRAADERRIGHAVKADVVGVFALAGDETLVFLAHNASANTFNTHNLDLSIRAALSREQRGQLHI
jgi:hypothetical protein